MSSSRTELARSLVVYASVIFLALFLSWILVVAGKSTYIVVLALAVTARGVMFVLSRRTGRNASERFQELAAGVARLLTLIHIVHIFWIAVVLRLGLAMFYNVEPISDFKKFFDHASAMSGGDLSVLNDSKSPLTVLWYGSLFRAFGASMVVVHCTNALLGGLQALLVFRITHDAFASRAAGHAAALVVAVLPSLVLFSAHPSSEMPSAAVLLASLLVLTRVCARREAPAVAVVAGGLLLGILLGLVHLGRNVGVMLLVVDVLVILVFAGVTWRKRLVLVGVCIVAMFAVLLPQIVRNYERYGVVSPNSHMRWYMNLLSGTNAQTGGRHSALDWSYVQSVYSFQPRTYPDAVNYAMTTARQRISSDPAAFARLAFRVKFERMWCIDDYGYEWLAGRTAARTQRDDDLGREAGRGRRSPAQKARAEPNSSQHLQWMVQPWFSNHAYYTLVLLALLSLLRGRGRTRTHDSLIVVIAGTTMIFFALHLLIEVQPRYHHFLPFLLAMLAGSSLCGDGVVTAQAEAGGRQDPASGSTA
jgi:hypothetical protein